MIFTIGHSNHTITHFIDLLIKNKIDLLVDVRSVPASKRFPHFNKESLVKTLNENNIDYLYKGDSLGGRPEDKSVLESGGRIILEKIQLKPWYLKGINEVTELSKSKRIALMCSEEDPKRCHRGHIITNALLKMKEEVFHIRKDFSIQPAEPIQNQPTLFT